MLGQSITPTRLLLPPSSDLPCLLAYLLACVCFGYTITHRYRNPLALAKLTLALTWANSCARCLRSSTAPVVGLFSSRLAQRWATRVLSLSYPGLFDVRLRRSAASVFDTRPQWRFVPQADNCSSFWWLASLGVSYHAARPVQP